MTRLVEIALFTNDVATVRRFYEGLLGAAPEAEWPGGAVFAAGEVKVLVHERGTAWPTARRTRTTSPSGSRSSTAPR